MIPRIPKPHGLRAAARSGAVFALAAALLFAGGCSSVQRHLSHFNKRESRPGHTKIYETTTVVPAHIEAGYFIIEVAWDKHGPWRFIVDTGSSVTLLSPDYVKRYPQAKEDGSSARSINVRAANGVVQKLPPANVRIIQLGEAQFFNVPVLVYDCADLSAHFGMKIDGILGFPLFRDTIFSLDYPQARLVISRRTAPKPEAGTTVKFNNEIHAPIIPVSVGNETLSVLIDSGSDGALALNPAGLKPEFAQKPRPGGTVGTLFGDRTQEVARLAQNMRMGDYAVEKPIVDLTDQLSSLGAEILRHYIVTFDPRGGLVTFHRKAEGPLVLEAQRSSGFSFTKTPAYWRVAAVVPGSPAEASGIQPGDIVSRIDGEPVSAWPLQRYDELVRRAHEITFTFVNGARENPMVISTFDLVP